MSLVVHHFKTKAGLKAAADTRSVALLAVMLSTSPPSRTEVEPAMRSLFEGLTAELDLMAYLRRMLIDGEIWPDLFTALVDATAAQLSAQERAGVISPSADPRTRAAFPLSMTSA